VFKGELFGVGVMGGDGIGEGVIGEGVIGEGVIGEGVIGEGCREALDEGITFVAETGGLACTRWGGGASSESTSSILILLKSWAEIGAQLGTPTHIHKVAEMSAKTTFALNILTCTSRFLTLSRRASFCSCD
jgi:hypothetical protein